MSPGGVAHCQEFHKGEQETLYLLRTSAEGLYLTEGSNLRRETEGRRERERELHKSTAQLDCDFQ